MGGSTPGELGDGSTFGELGGGSAPGGPGGGSAPGGLDPGGGGGRGEVALPLVPVPPNGAWRLVALKIHMNQISHEGWL